MAELAAKAARQDHELLEIAAREAQDAIERELVNAAIGVGDQLLAALPKVLEEARRDAPLLAALAFDDPAGLAHHGPAASAAYDRLAALSVRHDAARKAALAVHQLLDIFAGGRSDAAARRASLHQLNIDAARPQSSGADPRTAIPGDAFLCAFVSGGLTGNASSLVGKGVSPAFSRTWRWAPELWAPRDHPVARLVDAALAPVEEPAPPPDPVPAKARRPVVGTVPLR